MTSAAGAPLAGRRILLTRRPEQSQALRKGLVGLGAEVVEVPLIAVAPAGDPAPLEDAVGRLASFDWIVFTSANAVDAVADRLEAMRGAGRPSLGGGPAGAVPGGATTAASALGSVRVASVGPATTEAVQARFPGVSVALVPAFDFRAEGLIEAFRAVGAGGRRILLPASDRARDALRAGLAALGAKVERVTAYCNVPPEGVAGSLAEALRGGIDLVVFASPSAVDGFAGAVAERPPAAVIGPVTEAAVRRAGFPVAVVAHPSTAEGLLAALAGC